ncbi:predicted protein [Plenodomus lingam JN3]|uniref:Predicted protein n=1 Tax=Leptosphaeria maculans (strain JN3 / isolate v23.1.3 / race Av1-4-5-6-7-8) TaxID=985895 RepID=E5AB46_LEPMJ|nr:predicted protein [Plenodomus lingam JN3]CBY00887.1 predicted protein [Plenodomus lingam JN3]
MSRIQKSLLGTLGHTNSPQVSTSSTGCLKWSYGSGEYTMAQVGSSVALYTAIGCYPERTMGTKETSGGCLLS